MTSHKIGTREEWLAARQDLLEAEKSRNPKRVWRPDFTRLRGRKNRET